MTDQPTRHIQQDTIEQDSADQAAHAEQSVQMEQIEQPEAKLSPRPMRRHTDKSARKPFASDVKRKRNSKNAAAAACHDDSQKGIEDTSDTPADDSAGTRTATAAVAPYFINSHITRPNGVADASQESASGTASGGTGSVPQGTVGSLPAGPWVDGNRDNIGDIGVNAAANVADTKAHEVRTVYRGRRTELTLYHQDVKIRRYPDYKGGGLCRKQVGGGKRGKIKDMTKESLVRLRFTLRNGPTITQFATVTYGSAFPTDPMIIKKHVAALRRWLTKHGYCGVWVLEFQDRGALHVHLVLTSPIDIADLRRAWRKIIGASTGDTHGASDISDGCEGCRVGIGRVRNRRKLINYITKFDQKKLPEGTAPIGRWWGTFGGYKAEPIATIIGPAPKVAPMVRLLLKMVHHARASWLKRIRDNGRYSLTLYGVTPRIMPSLRQLALLFLITNLLWISDSAFDSGRRVSGGR